MIREDDPPQPSDRISTLGEAAVTISTHRKTEPAKLSGLLRRDLDWIVMKALEKDRTRRYQTASDFARDIQRYLADEPIEARRPTLRDRVAKWGRRHRTIVSTATVFLLGGAAAAVFLSIVMLISKGEGTVKLEFADNTVRAAMRRLHRWRRHSHRQPRRADQTPLRQAPASHPARRPGDRNPRVRYPAERHTGASRFDTGPWGRRCCAVSRAALRRQAGAESTGTLGPGVGSSRRIHQLHRHEAGADPARGVRNGFARGVDHWRDANG